MWLQIVLSALLAVVAVRFTMYAAGHELVRALTENEDFSVRYPRAYMWIGLVLFIVAGSLVLSMVVWQSVDALAIICASAFIVVGLWYLLRGTVWRIEVRQKYLIFVSMLGIKHLVHYDDISSVDLTDKRLEVRTVLKIYSMSSRVIYLEDFLWRLQDNHVPIYRDDDKTNNK